MSYPLKVIVGAGGTVQEGWVPLDEDDLDITKPEDWATLFEPNSIDAILAEHVWEHMFWDEGIQGARNAWWYLKPGGTLRLAVPDGNHPDPTYIDWVAPGTGFNGDDHKVLYDYRSLSRLLQSTGFYPDLREWFDEQGVLHSASLDWDRGRITRASSSGWAVVLSQWVGTRYTSLVIDGVKMRVR